MSLSRIAPRLFNNSIIGRSASALAISSIPRSSLINNSQAFHSSLINTTTTTNNNNSNNKSYWTYSSLFLIPAALLSSYALSQADASDSSPASLSPNEFRSFSLKKILPYNHDTKVYVFSVDKPLLPITSFVLVRAIINGKEEIRPYTPIDTSNPNEIHLLVKSYPNGKVSKYFSQLKQGDTVDIKGPLEKLKYIPNQYKEIGAIAGGTGITPILQLIENIMLNPKDKTKITLLFANKTQADILLKEKLTIYSKLDSSKFKVIYLIDNPEKGWTGPTGFINEELIEKYLPKSSKDSLIVVCGPPPMMKLVSGPKGPNFTQGEVDGILKSLDYKKDNVFKF